MTVINDKVLGDLGLARPKPNVDPKSQLGQQAFLKLMTTQLNNQDPMKPMSSGDFFNQIAQFSSVAGIQDLQKSFSQVASAMLSSQALQASSLVGRDVLVPGQEGFLPESGGMQGSVSLPQSGQNVRVDIQDAAGSLVKRIKLGSQAAGMVKFQWDGRNDAGQAVPSGQYTVNASADLGGTATAMDTLLADRVESVTINQSGQGISLNLKAHGAMDLAKVKQIM